MKNRNESLNNISKKEVAARALAATIAATTLGTGLNLSQRPAIVEASSVKVPSDMKNFSVEAQTDAPTKLRDDIRFDKWSTLESSEEGTMVSFNLKRGQMIVTVTRAQYATNLGAFTTKDVEISEDKLSRMTRVTTFVASEDTTLQIASQKLNPPYGKTEPIGMAELTTTATQTNGALGGAAIQAGEVYVYQAGLSGNCGQVNGCDVVDQQVVILGQAGNPAENIFHGRWEQRRLVSMDKQIDPKYAQNIDSNKDSQQAQQPAVVQPVTPKPEAQPAAQQETVKENQTQEPQKVELPDVLPWYMRYYPDTAKVVTDGEKSEITLNKGEIIFLVGQIFKAEGNLYVVNSLKNTVVVGIIAKDNDSVISYELPKGTSIWKAQLSTPREDFQDLIDDVNAATRKQTKDMLSQGFENVTRATIMVQKDGTPFSLDNVVTSPDSVETPVSGQVAPASGLKW